MLCEVPGPCEPEDLIDGIIFAANYLGCTQVLSDKNPSKSVRMSQAHEAVSRIKVICTFRQILVKLALISFFLCKYLNLLSSYQPVSWRNRLKINLGSDQFWVQGKLIRFWWYSGAGIPLSLF